MDFKTITETLAANTRLSAKTIVAVANLLAVETEPKVIDLRTMPQRLSFARTLPEVHEAYRLGKKIVAIKALREASKNSLVIVPEGSRYTHDKQPYLGLLDAKLTIDELWVKGLFG